MRQKGIVHLFLLVVVVIVAVGAIGYLAYQNAQLRRQAKVTTTPVPTQQQAESTEFPENTDWKTYTNSEYGFKFEYPSSLVHKSEDPSGADLVIELFETPDYQEKELNLGVEVISGISFYLSLKEDSCSYISQEDLSHPEISDISRKTINGNPIILFHFSWDNTEAEVASFERKDICPSISVSYGDEYEELWVTQLYQILSTFEFTE